MTLCYLELGLSFLSLILSFLTSLQSFSKAYLICYWEDCFHYPKVFRRLLETIAFSAFRYKSLLSLSLNRNPLFRSLECNSSAFCLFGLQILVTLFPLSDLELVWTVKNFELWLAFTLPFLSATKPFFLPTVIREHWRAHCISSVFLIPEMTGVYIAKLLFLYIWFDLKWMNKASLYFMEDISA